MLRRTSDRVLLACWVHIRGESKRWPCKRCWVAGYKDRCLRGRILTWLTKPRAQ